MVTIIYAGRISHLPLRQQAHMIHGYHHIRRTYITPTPETTSTHDTWIPSYTPDVYHTDPWDNKHTWYMVTTIYAGRISHRPLRQQAHMIHGYHHIRQTYITPTPETTSTHDTWLPPYKPDVYIMPTPETTSTHDTWLPSYMPDVYHADPWDNKHTWYMVTIIYAGHISHRPLRQQAHMIHGYHHINRTYITPTPETTSTHDTWLPSYTPDVYHTDPWDNKHTWYMVTIIYAGRISHRPLRQQAHMIHGYHHIRRTYIMPTPETTSTHDTWLPSYSPDVYHTDPWDNKHTWYMVTIIYAGRISHRPLRQQAHMIHGYHHIRRTYITPTPETTSTHDTWLPSYTPDVYHTDPWDNKHTWYMDTIIYAGRISHLPLRQQAHMIHGYHHIRRTYITPTPETTSTHDTWIPSYTPDVYHTYPWDNKHTWYMVTIIYAGRISHRPLRQQAHMIHGYHHIRRTYITPTPETTSTHDTWLPPYTPDVYHTDPWDNKHTWYMVTIIYARRISRRPLRQQAHMIHGYHHISRTYISCLPLRQQAHMIHGYHHICRTYITPTPETTSTHDTWLPSYTPDIYHTDPWDNKHTWYMVTII